MNRGAITNSKLVSVVKPLSRRFYLNLTILMTASLESLSAKIVISSTSSTIKATSVPTNWKSRSLLFKLKSNNFRRRKLRRMSSTSFLKKKMLNLKQISKKVKEIHCLDRNFIKKTFNLWELLPTKVGWMPHLLKNENPDKKEIQEPQYWWERSNCLIEDPPMINLMSKLLHACRIVWNLI